MYRNSLIAAIAAAVALLSSGTARRADAAVQVDPCSLLTMAQVSSAVGGTVKPGSPISTTGCSWSSESPRAVVTISFALVASFARLKAASSPAVQKSAMSGVGDDAFYSTLGPMTTLTVQKGNTAFVMHVYGIADPARQKEIEKTLATTAASKL